MTDSDGTWKTRQLAKDEKPWDWETVFMPHVATCPKQPPGPASPPPLPPNVIKFDPARRRGGIANRRSPLMPASAAPRSSGREQD